MNKPIVIWSDEHTLGHLVINAKDQGYLDLLNYSSKENSGTVPGLACQIRNTGTKYRNGMQKFFCVIHQCPCSDIKQCKNNDTPISFCKDPFQVEVEKYPEIALWPALPAFVSSEKGYIFKPEAIGVHIHIWKGKKKIIDETKNVVIIPFLDPLGISVDKQIAITPPPADSYFYNKVNKNRHYLYLHYCSHCGEPHTDLNAFADFLHSKHQCGKCGRESFAKEKGMSNALLAIKEYEEKPRVFKEAEGEYRIKKTDECDYLIWPTSEPILWKKKSPILMNGVHIHVIDKNGKKIIDETFQKVTVESEKGTTVYTYKTLIEMYLEVKEEKKSIKNFYTEMLHHQRKKESQKTKSIMCTSC